MLTAVRSPRRELNSVPVVYKTTALPMSYRGMVNFPEKIGQLLSEGQHVGKSHERFGELAGSISLYIRI